LDKWFDGLRPGCILDHRSSAWLRYCLEHRRDGEEGLRGPANAQPKDQNMKREENNKQEQNVQTEQKQKPVLLVRSGLRAGASASLRGCIDI
jgi:hypothetical protein